MKYQTVEGWNALSHIEQAEYLSTFSASCCGCPFKYHEITEMMTHYSFKLGKYRVYSQEPPTDPNFSSCNTRITIGEKYYAELKEVYTVEYFTVENSSIIQKIETLITFS